MSNVHYNTGVLFKNIILKGVYINTVYALESLAGTILLCNHAIHRLAICSVSVTCHLE